MIELYNELMSRLKYLDSHDAKIEMSINEIEIRKSEITLSIVRVQQILLKSIKNK
jgi:hypothetical protein